MPITTFEGDYETVDKHKGRYSTLLTSKTTAVVGTSTVPSTVSSTVVSSTISSVPNICEGSFDAVGLLREEVFIFKGAYVWRLNNRLKLSEGYPIQWREMFNFPLVDDNEENFGKLVTKIDAVYERETDGSIVFFTGKFFWVYNGENFTEDSPQPLSKLGITADIDRVDAAMVWGEYANETKEGESKPNEILYFLSAKNHKTYLFSGNYFWRFNETTKTPDVGYPLTMDRWFGIPSNLDAAVTLQNGSETH